MNGWHAYDEWERTMTMSPETRDAVREGAKRSAAAILPMIFNMLGTPSALLDVGCGEGWWMHTAQDLGVGITCGVDYDHEWSRVNPWDAESGDALPMHYPSGNKRRRWPLALCLEVAEHLTPAAGDHLVAELCRVADAIVWSAAIPGQGGDGHINEQWPEYWHERFAKHGYLLHDPGWRLDLWDDSGVEPWYAQNLLLAAPWGGMHGSLTVSHPPLSLVHPVTWAHHRGVPGPRS